MGKGARNRRNSALRDHQRRGKILSPPLMSIADNKLKFVSWEKDMLPDALWIAYHIDGDQREANLLRICQILDALWDLIKQVEADLPERFVFAGRLSDFEVLPAGIREFVLRELTNSGDYEEFFPEDFFHSLGMYPTAPASWTIGIWRDRSIPVNAETAERCLSRLLSEGGDGRGELATLSKMIIFRQYIAAKRISFSPEASESFNLLPRYPNKLSIDEKKRAEASVRASFLMLQGLDDEVEVERVQIGLIRTTWCRKFWRSNWNLYSCSDPQSPLDNQSSSAGPSLAEAVEYFKSEAEKVKDRFLRLAQTADPDLYDNDRYEVITGIVGRLIRNLSGFVLQPRQWTMEYGAPAVRAMVEGEIVLRWLLKRDDPAMYRKFKDYGRGRLKLLKLHCEEYLDSFPDEESAPAGLAEYVKYLDLAVNQDLMEEFQEVNLGGNFSGIDTRKMAQEVSMENEYRLLFSPASSNVHGEWSTIDEYVFSVCRNPLHRRHRAVKKDMDPTVGSSLVESLLELASALVDDYEGATVAMRRIGGAQYAD